MFACTLQIKEENAGLPVWIPGLLLLGENVVWCGSSYFSYDMLRDKLGIDTRFTLSLLFHLFVFYNHIRLGPLHISA